MRHRFVPFILITAMPLLFAACAPAASPSSPSDQFASSPRPSSSPAANAAASAAPSAASTSRKTYSAPPPMMIDTSKQYTATLHTTDGDIRIQLLASEAPTTVNNFVFLARDHFYDGVKFHRIIKGFMIQTGDPLGNGTGGPGYRFQDEKVNRPYTPGTVAMANAGPNTNGSQFFIMDGNVPLPPNYTIFGQVSDGQDVVDKIANTPVRPGPTGENSTPTQDVLITSVDIIEQ